MADSYGIRTKKCTICEMQAAIAADYGVSREAITMIRRGKNWPHV